MKEVKTDIRTISLQKLQQFFINNQCPKFRANQTFEWLWKRRELDFEKMTNLSLTNRQILKQNFQIQKIRILKQYVSIDGTVKFLFELKTKKVIEGVLIPQLNRLTACISSQVGCSLACTFCATGKLKLESNLTTGEIYDQVFLINQYCLENFQKPITNIVFMGMGEPLLNFKNVLQSIHYISSIDGMGISARRITVSTVGLAKIIRKIADMNPSFNLAISLHSANNKTRSSIMSINKTNNLESLSEALIYFYNKTNIRPTYEYILLNGVNDSIEDANQLIKFCKIIPCKVNLIEYNKVDSVPYEKSTKEKTHRFINKLEEKKILVKLRKSRGEDINAGCGQLANKIN